MLVFRQLFDPTSSTYTYLLGCSASREAVLIDPVFEQVRRDAALIGELGLQLMWTLETHVHADHVTGAWLLKQKLGSSIALSARGRRLGRRPASSATATASSSAAARWKCAPRPATPTAASPTCSTTRAWPSPATALLIRGCGRTDFQQGDPRALYRSVRVAHLLAARDLPALSRRTTIAGSPPPASPRRRSSIRGWAARSARATSSAT